MGIREHLARFTYLTLEVSKERWIEKQMENELWKSEDDWDDDEDREQTSQ